MRHLKSFLAAIAAVSALSVSAQVESTNLTRANASLSENFDSMWDGTAGTKTLPDGWYVYEHMAGPYDFSAVKWINTVNNLDGNANTAGTYNFNNTENPADRAVGGQSSDASGRCHGISYMTSVTNGEATDILTSLNISYNVEKYRKNTNAGGFRVQLYTSTDGVNWTSAGEQFYTFYAKDSAGGWPTPRPFDIQTVSAPLLADLAPGQTIYLAWNIAVNSGSTYASAQALGIDDVEISATFADPASLSKNIYIEDVTGWEQLGVSANGTAIESDGTKAVNGVSYKIYPLPATLPATLTVGNGVYYNIPTTVALTESKDYYLTATRHEIIAIDNVEDYAGYVVPGRPAFVASGLYIRGEVNSWGAAAEWQFSNEGESGYALYDKTLSGAFKVADANWSSSANYGAGEGSLIPGVPYTLDGGSNPANIGMGNLKINAKEIRLNIDGGNATLTVYTDDDATGSTKVYVIGDHNGWNYMDDSGVLTYDNGLFKGTLSMPKGAGLNLSTWNIYQTLGMGGVWGLAEDATVSTTNGTLVKGQRGKVAVRPGSYDIAFNIETGEYTLTEQAATAVGININPQQALLVPGVPENVKIFSMNNSLIEYNDEPNMFVDLATAMGKENVSWTRHTNLGKSLDYHWDEGEGLRADGQPGAKMMIRSDAWTHIILQEQSTRPNTSTDAFYASVRKWVAYIRENCPNPNAIIILPLNWVKSDDITNASVYKAGNDNNKDIYTRIADELGVVVCPVSQAYNIALDANGSATKRLIYSVNDDGTDDNVHPTPVSTYLAACMEYSLIYGEPVSSVTWVPTTSVWRDPANGVKVDVNADDCAKMRIYGQQAMDSYKNKINHVNGTVTAVVEVEYDNGLTGAPEGPVAYTVSGGGSIDNDGLFTSDGTLGTFTITAAFDGFNKSIDVTVAAPKTEVITYPAIELNQNVLSASEDFDNISAMTLPEAWRVGRNTTTPRGLIDYSAADETVMYEGGVSLPSNAKNGTWSFGENDSADRAIGGITTGVAGGTRAVNLFTHLLNTGNKNLTNVVISYDVEKYRKGNNSAGFAVQLYYSYNGKDWTGAGEQFYTKFDADNATEGYATVPGETVTVSGTLPIDLEPGVDVYLAWNISAASGDNCAGAMALAIDNFELNAELPAIPTAAHYIYVDDRTGWAMMGLYAWGDKELFGAWPGAASVDEIDVNGTMYKVFLLDNTTPGTYHLIFNNYNNGQQAPDFDVAGDRDYYLQVTPTSVKELSTSSVAKVGNDCKILLNGSEICAAGAKQIAVYSASGAKVAATNGDRLNLRNLVHGVYVVRVLTDNGVVTQKMLR